MIKCRNCEYGDNLKIFKRDRTTKVVTQVPCGYVMCSRPGRKNDQMLPVRGTKKSCRHFIQRQEG